MKLYRLLILVGLVTPVIHADTWTDPQTGINWRYTLSNGTVAIGEGLDPLCTAIAPSYAGSLSIPTSINGTTVGKLSDYAFLGCTSVTAVTIPEGVTSIGLATFHSCRSLASVTIPEGVTSIGEVAFSGCSSLISVVIPESVTTIGSGAFDNTYCKLIFTGRPPSEGLSEITIERIEYPEEYTTIWERALFLACQPSTVSVRAEMTTPKTMKVTYKVNSLFSRAKVRAVAWKDGVRSFANIVPVKTAAEGSQEAVPNGEAVTTGVEHTFIWQVSDDWSIDLAKVAVEVLAEEAGLLPQDLVTIPATETHAKMTFTVNTPTTAQLFNALVWYYADGDSALTVSNGVVRINGTQVVSGSSLSTSTTNATALLNYLYGKLGYKVLSGSDLSYAKAMTRLSLSNSGLTQLSVKISEE